MPTYVVSHRVRLCSALLLATLAALPGHAQTLARPGWTGSGIQGEPWWRSAVFYRIAPEHFQDSDGDGMGDLRGIAQRMDYLHTLGVDAVVLPLPFDEAGFDDLLEEASRRHVRLVIGLDRSADVAAGAAGQDLVSVASHWLTRGAAGVLLPPPPARAAAQDPAEQMRRDVAEPLLLLALRRAAARMPGERVVIPEAAAEPEKTEPVKTEPSFAGRPASRSTPRALRANEPQLILSTLPLIENGAVTPAALLAALTGAMPGDGSPLLQLGASGKEASKAGSAPEAETGAEIAAAALLTQRAAVLLEYGQELGLAAPERMPWTPGNVTLPPEPPPEEAKPPAPPAETVYGPYRPYVPPPPRPKPPPPPAPGEPVLPDPNTLPGFTSKTGEGDLQAVARQDAVSGTARSVVVQDRDPHSLLNLYRRLLALHHGNATMRSGDFQLLHEGDGAGDRTVAWLRRAPAGARTAAPVVVAVNCGDTPAALSLESDFTRLRLGAGGLRSLLSGGQIMGNSQLLLAPHAVFVGELTSQR